MAYLIIDAGNTRVKVFVFEEDKQVVAAVVTPKNLEKKLLEIFKIFKINKVLLSSVGGLQEKIVEIVSKESEIICLSHKTKVPFINTYGTPETLGVDRIALMSAASVRYQKEDVLVVDAGTCITFDLLNSDNEYLGGAISPGLQMRYKALHQFTQKLPFLRFEDPKVLIGKNTKSSIHSGVVNGFVAEVDGIINQYVEKYPNLTVVLTGGDMNYLSKRLKNSIFENPNCLAEGLHAILKYETR